jgi:hypothetical protein
MQGGLSMLAAYADGTARYRNYSGHLIVYEAGGALGEQVKDLISTCEQFPLPSAGDRTLAVLGPARLSFLTPAGIKLYERGLEPKDTGPYDALLTKASALMVALLELRKQG